jgi:benzil reductase ((S)-benzoin forming)
VRTTGAEQKRRGGRCACSRWRPGVIETAMQEQIRAMTEEAFPWSSGSASCTARARCAIPADAARDLWALVVKDTFQNGAVLDLREG